MGALFSATVVRFYALICILFFNFFIVIIFTEGREGVRAREKHESVASSTPPTGTWPQSQAAFRFGGRCPTH